MNSQNPVWTPLIPPKRIVVGDEIETSIMPNIKLEKISPNTENVQKVLSINPAIVSSGDHAGKTFVLCTSDLIKIIEFIFN
jgi:hypothetical protein